MLRGHRKLLSVFHCGFAAPWGGTNSQEPHTDLASTVLMEQAATSVALLSRSGRVPAGQGLDLCIKLLQNSTTAVRCVVCDVASEGCVSSFMRWITSSTFLSVGESGRVGGVIHGAGVLRDAWAINQTVRDATSVFGPKAQGAWYLH